MNSIKNTDEQKNIINHIALNEGLVLVAAVAGSGKTTLLVEIAKALKPVNGIYLAYNKAIATEASKKFPKSVSCCTTHSLAYRNTVIPCRLKLGIFNTRSITERVLNFEAKKAIVNYIREFCLSKYTTFEEFAEVNTLLSAHTALCISYLDKMSSGSIECTHEFYLKLFHMMLVSGDIVFPDFDFIALDEAGDLNEVTLEIFKLLPAKRKILVGDPEQNIYLFNHTINCFTEMAEHGTIFPMSQSFRVNENIASKIETFCKKYTAPDMSFKGIKVLDKTIITRAYIARTNATLITKMINLNKLGISYGLTRTPDQIFEQPLSLCYLKYQGFIGDPQFRYLQSDVDNFFESAELQFIYKSPLKYIQRLYLDDDTLQQTISLINRYGRQTIIDCYEECKRHSRVSQTYTLGTAHSTKGLEFDEVVIADDLNTYTAKAISKLDEVDIYDSLDFIRTELNLYYVACSRAKKVLLNALCLDDTFIEGMKEQFKLETGEEEEYENL